MIILTKCTKCKHYLNWINYVPKTIKECQKNNKILEKECTKCMKNEDEI